MSEEKERAGGCLCGGTRYLVIGEPEAAGACHCRYCQLRSGAAFGVLAYFKETKFSLTLGNPSTYEFSSDSGNAWENQFCSKCGTTISCKLAVFPGQIGIMGGTFDPPSFWYNLQSEVFIRSKAHFMGSIAAPKKNETFFSYDPKIPEDDRLSSTP